MLKELFGTTWENGSTGNLWHAVWIHFVKGTSCIPHQSFEILTEQRCFQSLCSLVGKEEAQKLAAHPTCQRHILGRTAQIQSKKRNTKFSKRRQTFIRKAYQLHKDCEDVDVYVMVRNRRNNRIWEYSNGYTPPTQTKLVRHLTWISWVWSDSRQNEIFPIPIILRPENFEAERSETLKLGLRKRTILWYSPIFFHCFRRCGAEWSRAGGSRHRLYSVSNWSKCVQNYHTFKVKDAW